VFDGIQFADLWDPLQKRLNTTHAAHRQSVDVNSLTGAHEILFAENLIPLCSECHSMADKGVVSRTKLESKVSRQMTPDLMTLNGNLYEVEKEVFIDPR